MLRALFHVSGSVSVSALRMRIKKWNKLNNVGAILVVRISIRINFVRIQAVADPGFDLRGGVDYVNGGGVGEESR